MSVSDRRNAAPTARKFFVLVPLLAFLALAGIFLIQLLSGRDIAAVPSALIGSTVPETVLPPLEGADVPGIDTRNMAGKVTLLNVFASWCGPCRLEHPVLLGMAQDKRYEIVGLNYKDAPQNALRFLGDLGNPYGSIGVDEKGRAAINWGVYGVPETFLIGRDRTVLYKHVGPLSPEALQGQLLPALERALAAK